MLFLQSYLLSFDFAKSEKCCNFAVRFPMMPKRKEMADLVRPNLD